MARQYPSELHIGQKVLVNITSGMHPIPALVTNIDHEDGRVHVHPIGHKVRWSARPHIITNTAGQLLHFENRQFHFD